MSLRIHDKKPFGRKYLIDTCIWIDFYEDRKDYHSKPLGEYAWRLLTKIRSSYGKVVVTDHIIKELESNYQTSEIRKIFLPFQSIIEKRYVTDEQIREAKKIGKERRIPMGDILHIVVARDNNLVMVTRDNHFKDLDDISEHYLLEELI